ncbi:hypothetical protein ACHAWO_012380 [Cyclotella atomus]|uniref:Uncharacterized protein n=1 Tax=Cyclotella atomus TaxID=382360 RepID=A0ABD3N6D0_9STRA
MEHNAQAIIAQATSTLSSSGIDAAQNIYKSAILDWVDDITMGDAMEVEGMKEQVADLWLGYALLNRGANLFKSATEVYGQAIHCPVAGSIGKVWLEYAKFLEERSRPRTAQNLYIKALVGDNDGDGPAVSNEEDRTLLWNEFLRMIQTTKKNPDLTLEELKSTVEAELGKKVTADGESTAAPATVTSAAVETNPTEIEETRPAKRSRWNKKEPEETVPITPGSIDTVANVLFTASKNMPPDIETLWHARDGGSHPTPPEPPLFSAAPPKLGDPSGKDLVGNEAALQILKMMVAKTADGKSLGSALLDFSEACWMMTALKEEEVTKSHMILEEKLVADLEALEANLEARASVAGAALSAVQQANEHERNQFRTQAAAQREQLNSSSAWEMRKLLHSQQILLSSVKLPGFNGPTVDSASIAYQAKVCSVMHSAFYLRARVGEASHVKMLTKQIENLQAIISTAVKIEPVPQFPMPPHMPPAMYSMPPAFPAPPMYNPQFNHQL